MVEAAAPHQLAGSSASRPRPAPECVGFRRRALAASLDNATWFLGISMILGWILLDVANASATAAHRFLTGELIIVASRRKQRLGDRAARTIVVPRARSAQEQAA